MKKRKLVILSYNPIDKRIFKGNNKTTETIIFDTAVGENQNLTNIRAMIDWIPP